MFVCVNLEVLILFHNREPKLCLDMFRRKDKNELVATTNVARGTHKISTVKKISDDTIEQRTITQITTLRHSLVTREIESLRARIIRNTIGPQSPVFLNIFDTEDTTYEIDANPPSSPNNIGYQSPFSRKLKPYSSTFTDAKPFNSNTKLNQSSSSKSLSQPNDFPRYEPVYTSLREPSKVTSKTSVSRDPRIPTYDTNGKKRGRVLVINNIQFIKDLGNRKGSEVDEREISLLFKNMGFNVDTYRNLKQSSMLDKVTRFKNNSSLKEVDISIVVMMSHGSNVNDIGETVGGGFTQIYGIDNKGLEIENVLNQFTAESCPAMAGKPKIFIFQCCRGENSETLHNDARPMRSIVKKHADMLIAFSTLPGFYSIRDSIKGSWYIQSICEVFKKHAKDLDVETLLKIVDQELSKKHPMYQQTSTYESRGFKCCYLNPK